MPVDLRARSRSARRVDLRPKEQCRGRSPPEGKGPRVSLRDRKRNRSADDVAPRDTSAKGKKGKGKKSARKGQSPAGEKVKHEPESIAEVQAKLSAETKDFHQGLIDKVAASEIDAGNWKYEIFKHLDIGDDLLDSIFTHLDEIGATKNKRIYIGPGRDGSSDDKIPIDCKFSPMSTAIAFVKKWEADGYVKTTCAQYESNTDRDDEWSTIEDEEPLKTVTTFGSERPVKLAIFIHPPVQRQQ